ncbi:MAG: hypothetical protein R3A52_23740 [Polyangiales bacterium]
MARHRLFIIGARRARGDALLDALREAGVSPTIALRDAIARDDPTSAALVMESVEIAPVDALQARLGAAGFEVFVSEESGWSDRLTDALRGALSAGGLSLRAKAVLTAAALVLAIGAGAVGLSRVVGPGEAPPRASNDEPPARAATSGPARRAGRPREITFSASAASDVAPPARDLRPSGGFDLDPETLALEFGAFLGGVFVALAAAWATRLRGGAPARGDAPREVARGGGSPTTRLVLGAAMVPLAVWLGAREAPSAVQPPSPTTSAAEPEPASPSVDEAPSGGGHARSTAEGGSIERRPFSRFVGAMRERAPRPMSFAAMMRAYRAQAAPAEGTVDGPAVAVESEVDADASARTERHERRAHRASRHGRHRRHDEAPTTPAATTTIAVTDASVAPAPTVAAPAEATAPSEPAPSEPAAGGGGTSARLRASGGAGGAPTAQRAERPTARVEPVAKARLGAGFVAGAAVTVLLQALAGFARRRREGGG